MIGCSPPVVLPCATGPLSHIHDDVTHRYLTDVHIVDAISAALPVIVGA